MEDLPVQDSLSPSDSAPVSPITADGATLTPEAVVAVARYGATVEIPESVRERVRQGHDRVTDIVESGQIAYGINTGFGDLADTRIPDDDIEQLQVNLLRSHAAGTGDELPIETVRTMLLARLNALVTPHSGVREQVIDHLVTLLNEGIHPVVYSRGSLGASGDLAPLAHVGLVLIGEGEATIDGERYDGETALEQAGLDPLTLAPKEGLALINGTPLTTGIAALLVVDSEQLITAADIAGSVTTEVTKATTSNCDPAIHALRPHEGQSVSARNVRALTENSDILAAHEDCDRVQDAYSIRCLPQVHGAVRDAIAHLREVVETELNSVTDNPLVFDAEGIDHRANGTETAAVLSGGNFHGEPLALRLDYATSAICELAAISERRTDRILNPHLQEAHLPAFLAPVPGQHSGLMIAQYTAASLLNEIRSLGRPSMDNTPVSGNREDHVSMSAQSAFHARTALVNARKVVAIELACAVEGTEYLAEERSLGSGTRAAKQVVRDRFPPLEADRELQTVIAVVSDLIASRTLTEVANDATEEPIQ